MVQWKNKNKRVTHWGYYKGELLFGGEIPLLLNILASKILHYHIMWEEFYKYDLWEWEEFLKKIIELPEIMEYMDLEDGEKSEAISNSINSLKFPFFISLEDKLIIRELKFKQKWKVKYYLNLNNDSYKALLGESISDLQQMGRKSFDFEEFYITPQNLFNLQLTLIKIFILEYFSEDMPKVKYGMKVIFRGLIAFFYNNNKYYENLTPLMKMNICGAYLFLILWDKKLELYVNYNFFLFKILMSDRKILKSYQYYYYIKEEIFIKNTTPLIQKIISLLPFTLLLYGKYNLHIGGIGIFLGIYFLYRMGKIFLKWLILIFRSFYEFLTPTLWERIFNRILFPIITLLNLGGIILSFYILSLFLPYNINIQFLGILFYTIIRYIILEKLLYRDRPIIMDMKLVREDSPFWMKWRNKWVKGINDYLQF